MKGLFQLFPKLSTDVSFSVNCQLIKYMYLTHCFMKIVFLYKVHNIHFPQEYQMPRLSIWPLINMQEKPNYMLIYYINSVIITTTTNTVKSPMSWQNSSYSMGESFWEWKSLANVSYWWMLPMLLCDVHWYFVYVHHCKPSILGLWGELHYVK